MVLYRYSGEIILLRNMPDRSTYEQISDWLRIYKSSTNDYEKEKVRTLIVSEMVPVVKNIAKTIARRDYDPIEDLVQAGFIGLLKAIEKYDANKNDNFRIYAGYLIIGEMKHYIRDKLNMIRVPRYIHELTIRINSFTKELTPEEVSSLTLDEVASALDVPEQTVNLAFQAERRRNTISLEDVFTQDEDSFGYEEVIASGDYKDKEAFEDARITFEDVIEKLPLEYKTLIDMYYKQDMSKKGIAEKMQISQMSVTRKMKRAFEMMATLVAEERQKSA